MSPEDDLADGGLWELRELAGERGLSLFPWKKAPSPERRLGSLLCVLGFILPFSPYKIPSSDCAHGSRGGVLAKQVQSPEFNPSTIEKTKKTQKEQKPPKVLTCVFQVAQVT
jgi:hypothetical protein